MDKIIEIYKETKSIIKTSKILGLSREYITKHLKSNDIDVINYQNISRLDENIFEVINTEEKAYWIGFLYADGSVEVNKKGSIKIELTLQKEDLNHIIKFKTFLNSSHKIAYREKQKAYRISFRSKKLGSDLINKGCIPNKSLILKFPEENVVPNYLIKHFVRGYIDGDGSIQQRKFLVDHTPIFILSFIGTKEFLEALINKMNWKKLTLFRKNNTTNNTFQTQYESLEVRNMLDYLYKDSKISLDRKYKIIYLLPS